MSLSRVSGGYLSDSFIDRQRMPRHCNKYFKESQIQVKSSLIPCHIIQVFPKDGNLSELFKYETAFQSTAYFLDEGRML